ncbi:cyclin-dependent kinase 20 isoform X2 [Brachyhypopomus gauderio]|uniref:cyclin-dependent kinase 20 isoform X2 n=1 Tax=Brachyhypopomus gauderio TaxID=698409 RepID=UPI00404136A3
MELPSQLTVDRHSVLVSVSMETAAEAHIVARAEHAPLLPERRGRRVSRYSVPVLNVRPCSQRVALPGKLADAVSRLSLTWSMDQYSILGRIGEGAHGIVFKAKHIETGETVALKKVALRRLEDGIPNQALREIKALQEIEDNQHVVKLKDVFPHGTGFVLVFEYMLSDLSEVIRNSQRPLTESQVKGYMMMLLKGVAFCHENSIMHRDLKPANLLISSTGHLKIADFGLARLFSNDGERLYSHQVATRWYRAPELLYGARKYDEGVDLWAVGCIFGELLNNSPLFPGENDIEQLCCVLRVLGTPNQEVWPCLLYRRSRSCRITIRSLLRRTHPFHWKRLCRTRTLRLWTF